MAHIATPPEPAPATYRAMVFHRSKEPRLVTSIEEYQLALQDGWADTPAAFFTPQAPTEALKRGKK